MYEDNWVVDLEITFGFGENCDAVRVRFAEYEAVVVRGAEESEVEDETQSKRTGRSQDTKQLCLACSEPASSDCSTGPGPGLHRDSWVAEAVGTADSMHLSRWGIADEGEVVVGGSAVGVHSCWYEDKGTRSRADDGHYAAGLRVLGQGTCLLILAGPALDV